MLDQIIESRLTALDPAYRSFIESNFAELTAVSFGEFFTFNERKVEILENTIVFYLLFFFDEEQSITFISTNCNMSLIDARQLFYGIQATLPEELIPAIKIGFATFNNQNEEAQLASEIAETEKEFEAIQGIRTMASDMHNVKNPPEVVHTSSQAELLNRNVPTKSSEPSNRWETDR